MVLPTVPRDTTTTPPDTTVYVCKEKKPGAFAQDTGHTHAKSNHLDLSHVQMCTQRPTVSTYCNKNHGGACFACDLSCSSCFLQVVAVDWIFPLHKQICGSEGHFFAASAVDGAGRFLTFSKVNGRSLGDQVVSTKTRFLTKKIWKTTNNARQRQTTENDIHRERKN